MIKALAFAMLATPLAAQESAEMLALLEAHCMPKVQSDAAVNPPLERASDGIADSLLDGQPGRAWTAANPAIALFDYEGAPSCGVFGAGVPQAEFFAAIDGWVDGMGMVEAPREGDTRRFLADAGDGEVAMLFAMTAPGQNVAVLNALRLPANDWTNSILGGN